MSTDEMNVEIDILFELVPLPSRRTELGPLFDVILVWTLVHQRIYHAILVPLA